MTISLHEGTTTTKRGIPVIVWRMFMWIRIVSLFSALWVVGNTTRQHLLDEIVTHGWDAPSSFIWPNNQIPDKPIDIPVRKWAYAFLVGGVLNPLTGYRGFIYGVVVAAKILRDTGSRADVVVMIQLSYNTNSTSLPRHEVALLESVGVKIKYLPKFAGKVHEQFYSVMLEKFRVLEMTEYSRVLFLDSDVMPLCNMDYMFEMSEPSRVGEGETSEPPLFNENVVLAWKREPAQGGFFMFAPGPGKYSDMEQIIRRREEEVLNMSYPYWDTEIGWGHRFNKETDFWRSPGGRGALWDWHGAFADQGLIYYWAKYHQKSTSIIIGSEIESWGTDENGVLRLERTVSGGPLNNFTCSLSAHCSPFCDSPYQDFNHFTGKKKPWDQQYATLEKSLGSESSSNKTSPSSRWFSALLSAAQGINFNTSKAGFGTKKQVGSYPTYNSMYQHIAAKKERGWTAYT
jgi:hypothetical protein